MELSVIAQYIRKILESNKSASEVTEDASKEKSVSKEKGSGKKLEILAKQQGSLGYLGLSCPSCCPIYNLKFS